MSIRCDFEDDDAYEFANFDTVIYEDDRIQTKEESGAILGLADMSTYVIKEETTLAGDATVEHYVWQGIALKSVVKAPDGTETTTLVSLDLPSSIDASLFEIPKGYSVK